ncbi:hypothetical protein PR202_gb16893 [Eleusine coracana subsp. coracana]|uniref:Uncharacterized protein n=1 Tax=Eleusine coracana subsp. coracana TaxID=191504 RepID=A0AAV5F2M9_ELECO|nr:hypothetical protein PR202_gb16893 [Eleusine coracana subsp. coracana]
MQQSSSVPPSRDEEAPLRMYFIPFPTPGHALPMSDLARLFASRGADATLILTRGNAARLGGPVTRAAAKGHRIRIHALTLPADAAGLTGGHESADDLPTRADAGPFAAAVDLLAPPFASLLRRHPPDAVVFDGVLPWAATAAPELAAAVPRYAFTGTGCFALSVQRALLAHAPQDSDAEEPFLVPGLPDPVRLTRSRLAEATLPGAHSREFLNRMFDVERATAGWVVNSFAGLEGRYVDHYERETGNPCSRWAPVCLVNGDGEDVVQRGRGGEAETAAEAARVMAWMDAKPARSVVYVCFGSLTRFPPEQGGRAGRRPGTLRRQLRSPARGVRGGAARVRVGSGGGGRWLVGKEAVAERVRAAVADGGAAAEGGGGRRTGARAVEDGGSSYLAVGALMEDVRRWRRQESGGQTVPAAALI